MTINAHNFVADKLVDIVEDKHRRMQLMINSFTIFGLIFLIILFINSIINGNDTVLSSILGFFSIAAAINVSIMNKNREAGRIGLTFISYSLAILLLYTGGYQSTGMLWSYLLASVSIFVNPFRTGLVLNTLFLIITSAILLIGYDYGFSLIEYKEVISLRVILTLLALSGMCHILIFFQTRADQQILTMHEGGIASLAYLDSLTMLANRVTFRSVLYHAIQMQKSKKSALIYIDLDNFKSINDNYGHDYGDVVLAEYAQLLAETVRENLGKEAVEKYDIGRLGGDEFAVYVRDASNKKSVQHLADSIMQIITQNKPNALKKIKHNMGSSLGVVFVDTEHHDLVESLSLADKGMYEAKKAGKGSVRYIDID